MYLTVRILISFFLLFSSSSFQSCLRDSSSREPSPEIKIIVPNGFHGSINILENATAGVDVQLKDGCYAFVVPGDGKYLVKSLAPFSSAHTLKGEYADGRSLPWGFLYEPGNGIALFALGSGNDFVSGQQSVHFYVGSVAEAEKHHQEGMLPLPQVAPVLLQPIPCSKDRLPHS